VSLVTSNPLNHKRFRMRNKTEIEFVVFNQMLPQTLNQLEK
jgi:hypothetical protein